MMMVFVMMVFVMIVFVMMVFVFVFAAIGRRSLLQHPLQDADMLLRVTVVLLRSRLRFAGGASGMRLRGTAVWIADNLLLEVIGVDDSVWRHFELCFDV